MSNASPPTDPLGSIHALIATAKAAADVRKAAEAAAVAEREQGDRLYKALAAVAESVAGNDPNWIETWGDLFVAAGGELSRLNLTANLESLRYSGSDTAFRTGTDAAFHVYLLACAGDRNGVLEALRTIITSQAVAGGSFRRFLSDVRDQAYRWTDTDQITTASDRMGAAADAEPGASTSKPADQAPLADTHGAGNEQTVKKAPTASIAAGGTSMAAALPDQPDSFMALPSIVRLRAQEVWRAAHQLKNTIEAWQAWWRELWSSGDADPGAALNYSVTAYDAIDVLCHHRINAAPFDVLSAAELRSILPPVPDGRLAGDVVEADGKGGLRRTRTASWQELMRRDNRYYGPAAELSEDWGHSRSFALCRLLGFLNTLVRQLRDAPLSVVAGVRPTTTLTAESSERDNEKPLGQAAGAVVAVPAGTSQTRTTNRRHAKGNAHEKLISGLLSHHEYDNGSCGNFEPIRNNELADRLKVPRPTVSDFFGRVFDGHQAYVAACLDRTRLCAKLKILARDYTDIPTYGRNLPGEGRDNQE
jgi:hypothetical protein